MSHEETADALFAIARSIQNLGNGNASTEMGAIENLAKEVRDAGIAIAGGLETLADAVRDLANKG